MWIKSKYVILSKTVCGQYGENYEGNRFISFIMKYTYKFIDLISENYISH
jgi:hypothetical protein